MIALLALFACHEPSADPVSVFEAAWTDMDENYGNFDLRGSAASCRTGGGLAPPIQEVTTPDGATSYEGVGMPVDEEILNDPEALAAGTDAVLDRAMARVE